MLSRTGRTSLRRSHHSSTHLPLRINTPGVIPIIFAQSVIMLPSSYAALRQDSEFAQSLAFTLRPGGPLYIALYTIIILFFSYFYTAVVFNPMDVAENMRKNGGFIPGIRPGRPTQEYLGRVVSRITLAGALFLGTVAVFPVLLGVLDPSLQGLAIGGTGLLIVVSVVVETMKQIEAQLMMRNYEGFIR